MKVWRLPHERRLIVLLALASSATGQTFSTTRISLYGYSEDATRIRFDVQNNYNAPVTFYQVRLQAQCPDGTIAEAGGWSFDTLRTRASQPEFQDLAPLQIEAIEPGKTRHFEFIRPAEVSAVKLTVGVAETHTCQPSTLKDFTAIFEDGTAFGVRELIDKQFVNWRAQRAELKRWLDPLHELRTAQDTRAAVKRFRDRLNEAYDDCEDRPMTHEQIVPCQVNREIWHQVNRIWQQFPSTSPESALSVAGRLADYWKRVSDLVEQQLSHRN